MSKLDNIYNSAETVDRFAEKYIDYLSNVLKSISVTEISNFVRILFAARERQTAIYFIGNGGSAATASHFANDIAIGTRDWNNPFRAISLCDNQAIITAIGNDYGYEQIFTRQLQVLMKPGDVVVAISASGNSPNLLHAIEYANAHQGITVGLTAFDGGKLRQLAKHNIHVPTDKNEYGPAEDAHMMLDHLIGSYLMRKVVSEVETLTPA